MSGRPTREHTSDAVNSDGLLADKTDARCHDCGRPADGFDAAVGAPACRICAGYHDPERPEVRCDGGDPLGTIDATDTVAVDGREWTAVGRSRGDGRTLEVLLRPTGNGSACAALTLSSDNEVWFERRRPIGADGFSVVDDDDQPELRTDGGQSEEDDDDEPDAQTEALQALNETLGVSYQILEKQSAANTRQADALEELVEQTRIQNAVLLELVGEMRRQTAVETGREPAAANYDKGAAKSIEDRLLHLTEQVDVDGVDRVAEDQR